MNFRSLFSLIVFFNVSANEASAQEKEKEVAMTISRSALNEIRYTHDLTDSLPANSTVLSVAIVRIASSRPLQYENKEDELHTPALQILREAPANSNLYFDIKYNIMGSRNNPHLYSFMLRVK